MKLTESQLRQTIRRVIKEAAAGSWMEFIELAESGDYDSAGEWIQGLASDYGITLDRDVEDSFIEMASADATAKECQDAWNEYLQMIGV